MPSFMEQTLGLPTALLAMSMFYALGTSLELRATTLPAPISFAPDENWDGIDGQWSTFTLRVGTPEQVVRTLISFQSYQTWVVGPQGCETASDVGACTQQRGGAYNNLSSSTAEYIGIYDLWVDEDLGLDSDAIYIYDTVGLGLDGENGPTLNNTTVGQMAADTFYLGIFGLDPKPTNFSTFSDGSPSYMSLLKEQGYIPSVSAGYTAGAHYRFTGELASLTLGGYDSSKFAPNDVVFDFAADNEKYLMVGLQSITTPSMVSSSPVQTELLPGPIYAFLDTTVAELWLPLEACKAFEEVFGLEYDNVTELYLVNQTLHDNLKASNPTVNFTLGQGLIGGTTVQVGLPYSAFDLTAQPPYQYLSNESYYFPLRRAANDSQYTLGRTFFQEAYLAVDWEGARFNVSQCIWNQTSSEDIVTIPPWNKTSAAYINPSISNPTSHHGLSEGAVAGIAVGGFAIIVLFLMFVLCILQSRKKTAGARVADQKMGQLDQDEDTQARGLDATVFPKAELQGSSPTSARNARLIRSDQQNLLSAGTSSVPGTPNASDPPSSTGWHGNSRDFPRTSGGGVGTHSSQSSSQVGTSILGSGSVADPSEADSHERRIFEMIGDLPTVKEKDGRALSEKEAMMRRERIYNGVEQKVLVPPSAARRPPSRETPRRVSPGAVVAAGRPRRSSATGSLTVSSAARPASHVSSIGDRRSISGMQLTSCARPMSAWASPFGERESVSGNAGLSGVLPNGEGRSAAGPISPVSPVAVGISDGRQRRSVDGSTIESPVSPVAKRSKRTGSAAFSRVHRAFSFERQR